MINHRMAGNKFFFFTHSRYIVPRITQVYRGSFLIKCIN